MEISLHCKRGNRAIFEAKIVFSIHFVLGIFTFIISFHLNNCGKNTVFHLRNRHSEELHHFMKPHSYPLRGARQKGPNWKHREALGKKPPLPHCRAKDSLKLFGKEEQRPVSGNPFGLISHMS